MFLVLIMPVISSLAMSLFAASLFAASLFAASLFAMSLFAMSLFAAPENLLSAAEEGGVQVFLCTTRGAARA